jgi:hypothetical protein
MEPLERYFAAEKEGALWLLALGVIAVGMTIWLVRAHGPFRAMAVPLALIGLGQLGIGVGLLARTDGQVAALTTGLRAEPETARERELGRMERVNANFTGVEIVEAVLIACGVGLALGMRARPTAMAVGMGLVLQASVMLVFDLFAEARAQVYTAWLRGDNMAQMKRVR